MTAYLRRMIRIGERPNTYRFHSRRERIIRKLELSAADVPNINFDEEEHNRIYNFLIARFR